MMTAPVRPGSGGPAALLVLAGLAVALSLSPSAPAAEFALAYVGPDASSALKGIRLGIDESNVQGEFLGVRFSLAAVSADAIPDEAIAVFADRPGGIVDLAASGDTRAVFNLSDGTDSLRGACIGNALHVYPSDRMKADAVAQWRKGNPDAEVTASAWHGRAVKFAARDLNNRYRERFGIDMDELAWSGWFAARAVGDTLMRAPGSDAAALLSSLRQADGLDGQKGDPHSFRASGQLRQPLVLVGPDGGLLGEAPVRGATGGLESLGTTPCE